MLQFSITATRITNKLYLYIISIYCVYMGHIYTLCQKNIISLLLLYIRSYILGRIYYYYNYRILQQQLYIISICLTYIDNTYFSMLCLSFLLISTAQYRRLLRFQRLLINLGLTLLYIGYIRSISLQVYSQCLIPLYLNT